MYRSLEEFREHAFKILQLRDFDHYEMKMSTASQGQSQIIGSVCRLVQLLHVILMMMITMIMMMLVIIK
jgi:hypothetical protein